MDVSQAGICTQRQLLRESELKHDEKLIAMINSVLKEFGLYQDPVSVNSLQQGLINSTWKITTDKGAYVVQKINDHVFKHPELIDHNVTAISNYLDNHVPGYLFVKPLHSIRNKSLVFLKGEGYYRAFPFIDGSHSLDVVETPAQAFEAAKQFGRFTCVLSGIELSGFNETIPQFHDLSLRYNQFMTAANDGNTKRLKKALKLVEELKSLSWIVDDYKKLIQHPGCNLRVTHHDTKISNVLFDSYNKGICVIDLDTVMPGYFFSDVGDMMRTYLSPVSEEERDLEKIEVRDDFYEAVVHGYYTEMRNELTSIEKANFFFAGVIMIYMQAIRFLTDYLNDDVYYGEAYPGHNLNRALNQSTLLKCLLDKQQTLERLGFSKIQLKNEL